MPISQDGQDTRPGRGWYDFAATMLIIAGAFNATGGIVDLVKKEYFLEGGLTGESCACGDGSGSASGSCIGIVQRTGVAALARRVPVVVALRARAHIFPDTVARTALVAATCDEAWITRFTAGGDVRRNRVTDRDGRPASLVAYRLFAG